MSENILKDILGEICAEEEAQLNSLPSFKPSLRHKLAMKRIFYLYEKKRRKAAEQPKYSEEPCPPLPFGKKLTAFVIVILCALLTGFSGFLTVYFTKDFQGTIYFDNTRLFAVNLESGPETVEYEYRVTALPDGFYEVSHSSSSTAVYTCYCNASGQEIAFIQTLKKSFDARYNTEKHSFKEIEIDGRSALFMDAGSKKTECSILVWDNGDYILEVKGNLSKDEAVALAKSAKISEKQKDLDFTRVPF